MRTIVAAAATLISANAYAQYSHHLYGMPDFDQKRDALPGDGSAWCAPTAATDLMGYISNHGYPAIMDGPHNWQVFADDPSVNFTLNLMGLYMDTDPETGTHDDWGSGLTDFMNLEAQGLFTVTEHHLTAPLNQVTPFYMYTHLATGSLVAYCYGRYEQQPGGTWERTGGHCVAVNGLDQVSGSHWTVTVRNPGTDSTDITAQSIFANQAFECVPDDVDTGATTYNMWEMLTDSTDGKRRFIDGYLWVDTTFVLTPTTPGILMQLKPFTLTGDPTPHIGSFPAPAGALVSNLALHPNQLDAFVLTAPSGTGQPMLWRYNRQSHAFAPLLTVTSAAAPMCTSRQGDLYLFTGGQIRRFDAGGASPVQLSALTPAAPPGAMTYDDVNDRVIAVLPTTRRLLILPRSLDPIVDKPLPAAVIISGDVSVAVGARGSPFEGKYFLSSVNHAAIYQLGVDPATGRLVIEDTIASPSLTAPACVQVSDIGTLLVSNAGSLLELQQTSAGWQPRTGSRFSGLGSGPRFTLSRSRSDFDPVLHGAWTNTIDDPAAPETPDAACTADFNGDGDVGTDEDIEAFFACLAGNCCRACWSADFDRDGDIGTDRDIEAFFRVLAGGGC